MIRILIADDHVVVRRGLRGILAEAFDKLEVGEAGNFPEAVSRVAEGAWDLVLLDVNMPGRSGLEALVEIRRLQPALPVLMLSVYPEEEYAVRSFKLGAAGYLTKQSAADELLAAVRKVLAGGRYVSASLGERLAASLGGAGDEAPHEVLSARELQVLRLVAAGRTLKEIAGEMGLSEKTIGTYRSRISDKMGLRTNVDLTRYVVQHGLDR